MSIVVSIDAWIADVCYDGKARGRQGHGKTRKAGYLGGIPMRVFFRSWATGVAFPAVTAWPIAAGADHDRYRAAPEQGKIVPLGSGSRPKVEALHGCESLKVEPEWERGRETFVHEIELLSPQENVTEQEIDARSLEI